MSIFLGVHLSRPWARGVFPWVQSRQLHTMGGGRECTLDLCPEGASKYAGIPHITSQALVLAPLFRMPLGLLSRGVMVFISKSSPS